MKRSRRISRTTKSTGGRQNLLNPPSVPAITWAEYEKWLKGELDLFADGRAMKDGYNPVYRNNPRGLSVNPGKKDEQFID